MNKIKVLVVDDSAFMRKAIESMISKDPELEIIGTAKNGLEAIEMNERLSPDVMTLDIEMPRMDGLTALQKIMSTKPLPVIMVSSLTTEGADATMKALELGAMDFIAKDKSFASFGIMNIEKDLQQKLKHFARQKSHLRRPSLMSRPMTTPTAQRPPLGAPSGYTAPAAQSTPSSSRSVVTAKQGSKKLVVIGTSTGGPQSLQKVIPMLPADLGVPILVVQHMPPNFTKSLAQRLDSLSKLTVVEAQGKEKLEPNVVYIAKGGQHMTVKKVGVNLVIETSPEPSNVLHIPSVDVMVESVAGLVAKDTLGVIMTGMGSDGARGLKTLKQNGGLVVAQNEDSCIVYGMPRAVVESGTADEVVPLQDIYSRIIFHCK